MAAVSRQLRYLLSGAAYRDLRHCICDPPCTGTQVYDLYSAKLRCDTPPAKPVRQGLFWDILRGVGTLERKARNARQSSATRVVRHKCCSVWATKAISSSPHVVSSLQCRWLQECGCPVCCTLASQARTCWAAGKRLPNEEVGSQHSGESIDPWPRYFWGKVSRYSSHFYHDAFAKVCPPLGRK